MTTLSGYHSPAFARVADAFARNFADRGEVGASVCVFHGGECVVDLWAGVADRRTSSLWHRDTVGVVFSCTKGAVALCAHILASRGLLDLDAPVAHYWHEFAANGKEAITTRLILAHQSGLPAIRTPLPPGSAYDWPHITAVLADHEPFFDPGSRQGYQALTFGHLIGEIVRRIDGRDVGAFFRDEVAGPLSLDFHIGLPESDEGRVAPTIKPDVIPPGEVPWRFLTAAQKDPTGIQALTIRNAGRRGADTDSRESHAALLPSQGGIANGRSLASMYANLPRLVDAASLARMTRVASASALDATLLTGMRFSLGFVKTTDNRHMPPDARDSILMGEGAFGHPGMGGSVGFLDPEAGLAFGYTMNKQGRGVLLNERGQSLVTAAYESIGWTLREGGFRP